MSKSPIGWPGGKSRFAKQIVSYFPPHKIYVEAFGGSLAVLFAKRPSKMEVANDLHEEVVNFFWIVKTRPFTLIKGLDWMLASESTYNRFREMNPRKMTDVQRAVRFMYLNRQAFGMRVKVGAKEEGATYRGDAWTLSTGTAPKFRWSKIEPIIRRAHRRLENVHFSCRDFRELADKGINTRSALWYLDMPYRGSVELDEGYAGDVTPQELFDFTQTLRGKIIASHQANEEFEATFEDWYKIPIGKRRNQISRLQKGRTKSQEYLFFNFKPEGARRSFV